MSLVNEYQKLAKLLGKSVRRHFWTKTLEVEQTGWPSYLQSKANASAQVLFPCIPLNCLESDTFSPTSHSRLSLLFHAELFALLTTKPSAVIPSSGRRPSKKQCVITVTGRLGGVRAGPGRVVCPHIMRF